jgi:hypothetical protein
MIKFSKKKATKGNNIVCIGLKLTRLLAALIVSANSSTVPGSLSASHPSTQLNQRDGEKVLVNKG